MRGERGKIVDLAVGADKDVAEVVRVAIEDGEGGFGASENMVGGVVGGVGNLAEKIFTRLFVSRDIAIAPRGPEVFHSSTMATASKEGKPQHILVGGGDEP